MYIVRVCNCLHVLLFEFDTKESTTEFVRYCIKNCKNQITVEIFDKNSGKEE